ncbi:MAG: hypothetical protein ACOY90_12205 [Candidatus Zhuqueibacterota bacterium]
MFKSLSNILQDLKEGKNIENYLLIIIALVVAILGILDNIKQQISISVTLAVLSLLIYNQIKNNRSLLSLQISSRIKGISDFFTDRSDVPSIDKILNETKQELIIMGLQLGAVTHLHLPLLRQKAQKGIKIKLLIMSPINKDGKLLPWVGEVGKVHTFKGLPDLLKNNILHQKDWLDEINDPSVKANIEIKCYPTIPTASILFIDKDTNSGMIKVEPILHKFTPQHRPSFIVKKIDSENLYEKLIESFKHLWNEALSIDEIVDFFKKA